MHGLDQRGCRVPWLLAGRASMWQGGACSGWMSPKAWGEICRAATMTQTFAKLPSDISSDVPAWQAVFDAMDPQNVDLPGTYSQLAAFDKLLIIRMIRPDKLVPAVRFPLASMKMRTTTSVASSLGLGCSQRLAFDIGSSLFIKT